MEKKTASDYETETWLRQKLKDSKKILEHRYCGILFWKDFPFHLVNTSRGKDAYFRETGQIPKLEPSSEWVLENGNTETYNGKHFIFLNPILIKNKADLEIQIVLMHEILRVLHPYSSEKEIMQIEESCLIEPTEPDKVLDQENVFCDYCLMLPA